MNARNQTDLAVQLTGVSHRYKKTVALDDITLTLKRGLFHAIVGPDGVGKSTLLGLIATAKKLQSGAIAVLDQDVRSGTARRELSHRIAYMPQGLGRNLYPDLTINEHLDYFAALFGINRKTRAARGTMLLRRTGLAGFEDRRARNLSGGMKQKLALCCALIHEPELLVLDEPTTGVDPLSRREFWDLLKQTHAARPGLTLVCSTGYVEEARNFDEVVFVDQGAVHLQGTLESVLALTPEKTLTAAYRHILQPAEGVPSTAPALAPRSNTHVETIIEARRLTKRFGKFVAVDSIDLEVKRGEIFGFLGPNGCGKSTTMRMLTGLSQPTSGEVSVFGETPQAGSASLRARLGYMSQSFSLYGELSGKLNLDLNLKLQHVPADQRQARTRETLERFGLIEIADRKAGDLPLGQRQRLALACAVAHKPPLLILDEPTSGVDPSARDAFWAELHRLSDDEGVTIFVTTHYLSEAERCDRIAFMDAGRILATGPPEALMRDTGTRELEDAFVAVLEKARGTPPAAPVMIDTVESDSRRQSFGSLRRLWATATREFRELRRDPVRLGFSLIAGMFLLIVLGHGISMDVDQISFAVFDQDQTPQSRGFVDEIEGSRYFRRTADITGNADAEHSLQARATQLIVEIPSGYGRDLKAGQRPELGMWLDGGSPGSAETARSYALSLFQGYLMSIAEGEGISVSPAADVEVRFRYNPTIESAMAFAPGCIGVLLLLTPAMLMAITVAREKEFGSILNLYTTPLRVHEFILGKQLPYIAIGLANFLLLYALTRWHFGVPLTGSFATLLTAAALQAVASTGYGLIIAAFTRSQIAALVAAEILSVMPSVNYSGLVVPVSSLEGGAWYVAHAFPSSYFHSVVIGTFLKGLGFHDLSGKLLALVVFGLLFSAVSMLLTRKQER